MTQSLLLHFDGTVGDTTTTDSSPSAHTITLYNGAALSGSRKFGDTGLYLDGTNDYAQATGTLTDWSFTTGQAFTIDFWVKLSSLVADQPLLTLEVSANVRWILKTKTTGNVAFELYNGPPTALLNMVGGVISTGAWTHIALVRQVSGAINLYVNGSSVAFAVYATAFPGSQPVTIGRCSYPSATYANAYIDELRILRDEAAWTANFTPSAEAYPPPYYAAQEHDSPFHLGTFIMQEHAGRYTALIIEAEHDSPFHLGTFIMQEHAGRNSSPIIEAQHASVITIAVHAEHGTPITWLIENQHSAPYIGLIEAEHGSPVFVIIEGEQAARFSLLALIENEHAGLFQLLAFNSVEQEHAGRFNAIVESERSSRLTLQFIVHAEHAGRVNSTTDIHAEHAGRLHLLAFNLAEQEHGSPARLGLAPSIDVTDSAILHHNGRRVEIITANIKQDEGDPFWSGSVELAYAGDYALMAVDDPVNLQLGADTYSLIIDGKEKTRSFAQVSLSVTLLSPGVALTFPRAEPITKTWPAIMARTAAEEAIGAVIDWQIPDWLIPDSRLAMMNAAPLEVARKIAEAAGGILQSKPDGSFLARPLFPVSVPKWGTATPDHVLTDDLHNLSAQEMYRHSEIVNQVTIRDTSGDSNQDQTEYIADESDPLKGILYVWPRPWRPITVAHTGHPAVGLTPLGVQYLPETKLVEFKEGKSSVGRPVYSIDSVKWQYVNLGAVSFVEADLSSAIAAYSLAWITYQSRCYVYAVNDTIPETIQFLVIEP